jgi:LacI family transcriptional regulator
MSKVWFRVETAGCCVKCCAGADFGVYITIVSVALDNGVRRNLFTLEAAVSKRRTTLAEVAAAAGVSVATVSKVLNDRVDVSAETRRRVQKYLKDSEYRPAGSGSARPRELGRSVEVVVPELQNPYIIGVLEGIVSSAAAEGFEVVIGRLPSSGSWMVDPQTLLRSEHVGAIFITADASKASLKALDDAGFPVVVVDPLRVDGSRCISIGATNFTGGVTAAEHLLSLGHRRIGHAGGPHSADCSHARLAGLTSALRKAGIELDETLVTHCAFTYDAGRRAAHDLLDRSDRPTAIFAASDEIALGVMEEARRRSIRIPQDLSVVGFDDTFLASRSAPPLTTVAQPLLEMGRVATRSLAQMITNDVVGTRHIELATRLVIRNSTAPPSQSASSSTSHPHSVADAHSVADPPPEGQGLELNMREA